MKSEHRCSNGVQASLLVSVWRGKSHPSSNAIDAGMMSLVETKQSQMMPTISRKAISFKAAVVLTSSEKKAITCII